MSDSNVGLGMVPHRASCRCDECETQRLRERIADLDRQLKQAKSERDVATAVNEYNAEQYEQERNSLTQQLAEAQKNERRYLWLKENVMMWLPEGYNGVKYARYDGFWKNDEHDLDAAIDRAQKKK